MRSLLASRQLILDSYRQLSSVSHRSQLLNSEVRKKRNDLFEKELIRQRELVPRVEKITVECYDPMKEKNVQLRLDKGLSTPFNAAQHIHVSLIERSALATVNDQLWDMNRPLEEDSIVKFIHFQQPEDPYHLNKAFWRSCSFMLGVTLENLFQDNYFIELHSFPAPNVQSGSFVYDADLKFLDWTPSKEELMSFGAYMHRLSEKELPFERLTVDTSVAQRIFEDNQYKSKQIPSIAANSKSGNSVTLYRLGEHVDISGGPMVGNSGFLGRRCSIMAAHRIEHDNVEMYRFQGVALPKGIFLDHHAFGLLEKRASKLNAANMSSFKSVPPS
uniref:Large ribosomal subunit protein mL39 n=1 Tax=Caligus clemensi TaxID=344056 RepID=C1C2L2_CALCM|nr:Mitochondrial 39S ribosomal protein L39 [Caligus clemensi]